MSDSVASKLARVLSVGQCGYDHGSIRSFFRQSFGAEVEGAATFGQALDRLGRSDFDLVLVNRITDADGTSGLDLIRRLASDPVTARIPVMLVSNLPEPQRQALDLGARPGFGKADLSRPDLAERILAGLTATSGGA